MLACDPHHRPEKLSQSIRRAHDLRKGTAETEQRYRTKGGKSSLLTKLKRIIAENIHLPPRGYYTFSVAGGTCHDDRRKRTSHSKRYYSRIERR